MLELAVWLAHVTIVKVAKRDYIIGGGVIRNTIDIPRTSLNDPMIVQ